MRKLLLIVIISLSSFSVNAGIMDKIFGSEEPVKEVPPPKPEPPKTCNYLMDAGKGFWFIFEGGCKSISHIAVINAYGNTITFFNRTGSEASQTKFKTAKDRVDFTRNTWKDLRPIKIGGTN